MGPPSCSTTQEIYAPDVLCGRQKSHTVVLQVISIVDLSGKRRSSPDARTVCLLPSATPIVHSEATEGGSEEPSRCASARPDQRGQKLSAFVPG